MSLHECVARSLVGENSFARHPAPRRELTGAHLAR